MHGDLTQPTYSNMLQGTLTLEPRKRTFHGSPLRVEGFPFRRLLLIAMQATALRLVNGLPSEL